MAATKIPMPGSETGPCKEACQHLDCAAGRRDAESLCIQCGHPIGYGVPFYYHGHGKLIHEFCVDEFERKPYAHEVYKAEVQAGKRKARR